MVPARVGVTFSTQLSAGQRLVQYRGRNLSHCARLFVGKGHVRAHCSTGYHTGATSTMTSGQQDSTGKVASAQLIPSSETYHGSTTHTHTKPFVIGVCGGTASGKTSVCSKIIAGLVQNKLVRDCSTCRVASS